MLTDYGLHPGVGFQLIDDVLGCMGQAECLGKPVGQDAPSLGHSCREINRHHLLRMRVVPLSI